MSRKIFVHWKKRKWTFMFMIIGYVSSILIISMSIGKIDGSIISDESQCYGKKGEKSAIELYSQDKNPIKYEPKEVIKYLGSFGEVNVLNMGKVELIKDTQKKRVEIIPTYYENIPNWQPPLYKGSYISPEQCKNGSRKVLLGVNVAQGLGIKVKDKISMMGEQYEVVGIIGQVYYWNKYNDIIYIPMQALPEEFLKTFNDKLTNNEKHSLDTTLLYRVKDNKIAEIEKDINKKFYENQLKIDVKKIYEGSIDYAYYVKDTLISKIPLIIIALINISTMSVFWVMSRRKELTVKKILGANDKYIKISIKKDMLMVAIISVLSSIILQEILYVFIEPEVSKFGYTFNLNWVNGTISIIIALAVGYISSIFPANETLDITPVEGIKLE